MVQHISIEDYSYNLPDERIAKYPLQERDSSRLLVYRSGDITQTNFGVLPELLPEYSLIVRNNSKVIHARLIFRRKTGAEVEVFCLEPLEPSSYELALQTRSACSWVCMLGNAKRWRIGDECLTQELRAGELGAVRLSVERTAHDQVRFSWDNTSYTFGDLLEAMGILPLPPYLNRETEAQDEKTYQTVYAQPEGSVAAPTAGLHFTPKVFEQIRQRGIEVRDLTLHVGAGTFRPVKAEQIGEHEMHREFVCVSRDLIERLARHSAKVIAIGTTTVRTLESLYHLSCNIERNPTLLPEELSVSQWQAYDSSMPEVEAPFEVLGRYMAQHGLEHLSFSTAILIAPSYRFRVVGGLITNFHQPHSTLLLLIAAFVGSDWRRIYDYALGSGFRFLSYGDSSLLLP